MNKFSVETRNVIRKVWLLAIMAAFALSADAAIITGKIIDDMDTLALTDATVRLLRANKDSTYVRGGTTGDDGSFRFDGVARGNYVVKVSYVGYEDLNVSAKITSDGQHLKLGTLPLKLNTVLLDEAVVVGIKTPITVKEDTIEYNADTYKTQTNAVVEDLLKRLPGVDVGTDGKITANGKEVSKILLDGKEFFSDDPTVASKNIPADMVNKLQVIDRKSDLARLTGVDDGEDETVINLTVKKGMNNGWFGTVNGGYGTNKRYTGNLIANYFNNGNQFTILGGANNVNNLGFADGGAGRFQRFGGERGITTSQHVGLNFNVGTQDSEKFRAGGSVMYSHSDRDSQDKRDRQYLFEDSTSYYKSSTQARDKGHNVRGDFRIKWEADSFNTLEIRPRFSFNFSDSYKIEDSETRAGDIARTLVNNSTSSYNNDGKSYEASLNMIYNHNFKSRPGRSFSTMVRVGYNHVDENGDTHTLNTYFLKTDPAEREQLINRVNDNLRKTSSLLGRLTWTEPLGDVKNGRFINFTYSANYRYSTADKQVFDLDDDNAKTFNQSLSNKFANTFLNQQFRVGFKKVTREYNLDVGMGAQTSMSKSDNKLNSDRTIPARWTWSLAPFARFRYKFSKTRSLSVDYRSRSTQPSLTQLQPVADESNPLNIVTGNPELKPTFNHNVSLRYNDFDQRSQRSVMFMIHGRYEQNSIISTTDYDQTTGGRRTTYANVNGVWNVRAMNMLSLPLRNKLWYFTSHAFANYSQTIGYNNGQYNRSGSFSINLSPGMAYRNGLIDVELRPRYSFQTTHNTVMTASNRNVHTYGGNFNLTYTAPFGLVVSTDLSYSATSGYSAGYDTKQWLWNGSLAYQFLRDKNASVGISVYDILGQRKSVFRNVNANYMEDVAYNSLTRYGMITFTYRFTTFKKGEEPKQREDNFGPGGGPGRGPGGMGRPGGGFGGPGRRW